MFSIKFKNFKNINYKNVTFLWCTMRVDIFYKPNQKNLYLIKTIMENKPTMHEFTGTIYHLHDISKIHFF